MEPYELTCASCVWHTSDPECDRDGDERTVWRCWREYGEPSFRMATNSGRVPKGCAEHFGGD